MQQRVLYVFLHSNVANFDYPWTSYSYLTGRTAFSPNTAYADTSASSPLLF